MQVQSRSRLTYKVTHYKSGGESQVYYDRNNFISDEDPWIEVSLYKDDIFIGDCCAVMTKYGFAETHIDLFLDEDMNKGYGIKLYTKLINVALKKGWAICSSRNPSRDANRLWKSKRLRKKFKILKKGRRYHILGKI